MRGRRSKKKLAKAEQRIAELEEQLLESQEQLSQSQEQLSQSQHKTLVCRPRHVPLCPVRRWAALQPCPIEHA